MVGDIRVGVTPHPEVNAVLQSLLTHAQNILGARFVGLYLYGSLASGDFDPAHSDIDFVVVITETLPPATVDELRAMHQRLADYSDGQWAKKLEGTYLPQAALRRYDPEAAPCPTLNEGQFYLDRHGSDWVIQRHVLREHGVVIAGPAIAPLIDPVSPDELRQAVRGVLRGWWRPMLDNPAWLRDEEYLAYAVLTMCRALHALEHGTIVSKPTAARWARAALPAHWAALIEWACGPQAPRTDAREEVMDFIRYVVGSE